jgi:serine O-acetyltransferase
MRESPVAKHLEVVTEQSTPPVWAALRNQAEHAAKAEPALASLLNAVILSHDNIADALTFQLARKLGDQEMRAMTAREFAADAFNSDPALIAAAEADLMAVFERDPACKGYVQPFLFFKGFLALQTHRVSHWLWSEGRETLAFYLQSRASEVFQVDINPAARIGSGVFIDHGTGIVIGETAVVGDDVSMLHGVTLGGTGAERGDRHPKIGGRAAGRGRQGAGQHHHRRLRQGGLRLGGAEARAAALHGRRRAGPHRQLPDLRRARPDHGPDPVRGRLRLRDLRVG